MEGCPRSSMLCIDLKESTPVEFAEPLKKYISDHYQEDAEKYNHECQQLEQLRSTCLHPSYDHSGCSALRRYFAQMQFLQSRFPMIDDGVVSIQFTWVDLYSEESIALADARFEQAAILHNLGALHSQLGSQEDRTGEEGMKVACTHFQAAAGVFQHLKNTVMVPLASMKLPWVSEDHFGVPFFDLASCVLQLYINILLGQAQECLLEKSILDGRKDSLIARISIQVYDYYQQALGILESLGSSYLGSKKSKMWTKAVKIKACHFTCVSYIYMANHAHENQKFGEKVAYLKAAHQKLTEAQKQSKGQPERTLELLQFMADVLSNQLEGAEKDNDFIYHEVVPDLASLPVIKGASLVKPIPFQPCDPSVAGPDIFQRLIPMEAHTDASIYSEEKAKLLRRYNSSIETKNKQLAQSLANLHIDDLMQPVQTDTLPSLLKEKHESLSKDSVLLTKADENTKESIKLNDQIETILDNISALITEDDKKVNLVKEKVGPQETPPEKEDIKTEYEKCQDMLHKANQTSNELLRVFNAHKQNLELIAGPEDHLLAALPSLNIIDSPVDDGAVQRLRDLLAKVSEMKSQRASLEQSLRDKLNEDDITGLLVTQDGNKMAFFADQLKKHDTACSLIQANLDAQDKILNALTEANAKYARTRQAVQENSQRREEVVQALILSYNTFCELQGKISRGAEFYQSLLTSVKQLEKKCKNYFDNHNKELDKFIVKITSTAEPPKPPSRPSAAKPDRLVKPQQTTFSPSVPTGQGVIDPSRPDISYNPILNPGQLPSQSPGQVGPPAVPCQGYPGNVPLGSLSNTPRVPHRPQYSLPGQIPRQILGQVPGSSASQRPVFPLSLAHSVPQSHIPVDQTIHSTPRMSYPFPVSQGQVQVPQPGQLPRHNFPGQPPQQAGQTVSLQYQNRVQPNQQQQNRGNINASLPQVKRGGPGLIPPHQPQQFPGQQVIRPQFSPQQKQFPVRPQSPQLDVISPVLPPFSNQNMISLHPTQQTPFHGQPSPLRPQQVPGSASSLPIPLQPQPVSSSSTSQQVSNSPAMQSGQQSHIPKKQFQHPPSSRPQPPPSPQHLPPSGHQQNFPGQHQQGQQQFRPQQQIRPQYRPEQQMSPQFQARQPSRMPFPPRQHPSQQQLQPEHSVRQPFNSEQLPQQQLRPRQPIQPSFQLNNTTQQGFRADNPSQQPFRPNSPSQQPLRPDRPSQQPFRPSSPSQQPLQLGHPSQQPFRPNVPSPQSLRPNQPSQPPLPDQPLHQPFRPNTPSQQPFRPDHPSQQSFRPDRPSQQPFRPNAPFQQSFGPEQPSQAPFRPSAPSLQSFRSDEPFQQPFRPKAPSRQSFRPEQPFQQPFGPESPINQPTQPFKEPPQHPYIFRESGQSSRVDQHQLPQSLSTNQKPSSNRTEQPSETQFPPTEIRQQTFLSDQMSQPTFRPRGVLHDPPRPQGPSHQPFRPQMSSQQPQSPQSPGPAPQGMIRPEQQLPAFPRPEPSFPIKPDQQVSKQPDNQFQQRTDRRILSLQVDQQPFRSDHQPEQPTRSNSQYIKPQQPEQQFVQTFLPGQKSQEPFRSDPKPPRPPKTGEKTSFGQQPLLEQRAQSYPETGAFVASQPNLLSGGYGGRPTPSLLNQGSVPFPNTTVTSSDYLTSFSVALAQTQLSQYQNSTSQQQLQQFQQQLLLQQQQLILQQQEMLRQQQSQQHSHDGGQVQIGLLVQQIMQQQKQLTDLAMKVKDKNKHEEEASKRDDIHAKSTENQEQKHEQTSHEDEQPVEAKASEKEAHESTNTSVQPNADHPKDVESSNEGNRESKLTPSISSAFTPDYKAAGVAHWFTDLSIPSTNQPDDVEASTSENLNPTSKEESNEGEDSGIKENENSKVVPDESAITDFDDGSHNLEVSETKDSGESSTETEDHAIGKDGIEDEDNARKEIKAEEAKKEDEGGRGEVDEEDDDDDGYGDEENLLDGDHIECIEEQIKQLNEPANECEQHPNKEYLYEPGNLPTSTPPDTELPSLKQDEGKPYLVRQYGHYYESQISSIDQNTNDSCLNMNEKLQVLLSAIKGFDLVVKTLSVTKQGTNVDGFSIEWSELDKLQENDCATMTTHEAAANQSKNRYSDVLPWDDTRVKLQTKEDSDYINANFIKHEMPASPLFIATQGPIGTTLADFWLMVWEQKSQIIVMLTKEVEDNKLMCHQYCPKGEGLSEVFGPIKVTLKTVCTRALWVIRLMVVQRSYSEDFLIVTHLQFIGWPDKGVPESPEDLIGFIFEVRNLHQQYLKVQKSGPIVTHCSAGIGRTGTFIVLYLAIREFEARGEFINIPRLVRNLRLQRKFMVQKKEQYEFCYKTLSFYVHHFMTLVQEIGRQVSETHIRASSSSSSVCDGSDDSLDADELHGNDKTINEQSVAEKYCKGTLETDSESTKKTTSNVDGLGAGSVVEDDQSPECIEYNDGRDSTDGGKEQDKCTDQKASDCPERGCTVQNIQNQSDVDESESTETT